MNTFDDATEQWLAERLADAPPFTSAQLDLIQRTLGRGQVMWPATDDASVSERGATGAR